jgi:hypothetical protein
VRFLQINVPDFLQLQLLCLFLVSEVNGGSKPTDRGMVATTIATIKTGLTPKCKPIELTVDKELRD